MPPVLSPEQVANVLGQASAEKLDHYTDDQGITFIAIALAESRGDQTAEHHNSNGTWDDGLWQINSVHGYDRERLKSDPVYNARAALDIFHAAGDTFRDWSTWKSGAFNLYMPVAKIAWDKTRANPLDPSVTIQEAKQALDPLARLVEFIAKAAAWMVNPHNWVRVIEAGAGTTLVVVGMAVIAKQSYDRSTVMSSVKGLRS